MSNLRRHSPAFPRNRDPILAVLRHRWSERQRRVLELASGPGQHAVYFARQLPHLVIQPTEQDPALVKSINAWRDDAGIDRVLPGQLMDVTRATAPSVDKPAFDGALAINFFHMVPMDVVQAALQTAASRLRSGGELIVYDCFTYGGRHVSDSNRSFHSRLQAVGGAVHPIEAVADAARSAGFGKPEVYWLVANNQCVAWSRT